MSKSTVGLATTEENINKLQKVIDLILKRLEVKSKFRDAYTINSGHLSKMKKNGTLGKSSFNLINDCIGCHRFDEAAKLLWVLCQDRGCFNIFLYKCMMVVLENSQIEDKNEIVKKFSSDIQDQSSINKLDVQLEYILYALRNNVLDVQESYETVISKRRKPLLKKIPCLENVLNAYIALLDYIKWHHTSQDELLSIQSKSTADKAISAIKTVLEHPGTWDIFVLKLVEMLEYYENFQEIEDVLKKYVENNPEHINGYIYLCVHLHKYNTDQKVFIQYAKELAKLCPSDVRVLLLVHTWDEQDYPVNGKNKLGWQMLSSHLSQAITSNKTSNIEIVQSLWSLRCHAWSYMHFNSCNINFEYEDNSESIAYKVKVISALNPDHQYIKEVSKKVPHLHTGMSNNHELACGAEDLNFVYKLDNINTRECL